MGDALQSKSRGMKRHGYGFILAIFLAIGLLTFMAVPCYAQDEPSGVVMDRVRVFNSLISDNDTLFAVSCDIQFGDTQDYDVEDAFTFSLLDSDDNIVATANGLNLYNDGYGKQLISYYVESGITWGDTYTFRIMENPAVYSSPQYWDFTIGPSEYSDDDDQAESLKAEIMTSAISLSSVFEVELYEINESGSRVLSTYGELYYLQAIIGLQTMCPQLFSVQTESPDYTKRGWSYTFADALKTKYAGTFVANFMTGYAGLFSMDTSMAMNILSMFLFFGLMALAVLKFKATILSCTLTGYCLLLCLMLMGLFDMIWAGFMAFTSTAMGGLILFFNRS